jgi:hypothetical protein
MMCCTLTIALTMAWSQPVAVAGDAPAVRELDGKGIKPELLSGSVRKPLLLDGPMDLPKAFPKEPDQARLQREVDWKKHKLLLFAWSGSGGDKLTFKLNMGAKGPEIVFFYQAGFTDDLRRHVRLLAIPRDATWRFDK